MKERGNDKEEMEERRIRRPSKSMKTVAEPLRKKLSVSR